MPQVTTIAGRSVGPEHEPYIICELSANHRGSLDRMLALMEEAAASGADAIKIQTYTPDTMTIDHDGADFTIRGGLWHGRTLHDLYAEAQTPFEWHEAIFAKARDIGITLFSTPFDETAVDLLSSLDTPAYKIASFEIVDLPLIARVAREGKPMIISTGMANLGEIGEAVRTARENGCNDLILLHCVSSYPATVDDADVRTVPHLGQAFGCLSGLSDHTPGSAAAVAAVALGACVIEKHFTLDRSEGGPDAAFSLEPAEFKTLVDDCRNGWRALGRIGYDLRASERGSLVFRRSLYVVQDIAKGETLGPANIRCIRPGFGLAPRHLPDVLGKTAARDLKRGEPLTWDAVDGTRP